MDAAAPAVLHQVWPIYFVLTSYRRNPDRALEAADQIIASTLRSSPDVRTPYHLKGIIYIDKEQSRRALKSFDSALQLEDQPVKRAQIHIGRGLAFRLQRRTEKADEEFTKAEELAKDDPSALIFVRLAQNQPIAAAAEIRKFAKKNVLAPGVHNHIGILFSQLGNIDEAIAEYQEAIRIDPDDIAAYINLGTAYSVKRQAEDAAASYRKAIDINPHDERLVTARMALGRMIREQGRLEEAAAESRKAAEMLLPTSFRRFNPNLHEWTLTDVDNRTRARNALGAVLREQGKLDEAMAELAENVKFEPRNAEARHELALVLRDQEKPEEAIAELRNAIKLDRNAPAVHFDLASILRDQGKPDEAIAKFRETTRITPTEPATYRELGLVLFAQNKPDEAISELRTAITLDPNEPITHFNLGVILRGQGEIEEAIAAVGDAIRLGPHLSQAYLELAAIFREQGKLDDAVRLLREALERLPEEISIRVELASILRMRRDWDDAIAKFRDILKRDSASGASHYNLAMTLASAAQRHPVRNVAALIEACQLLIEGKLLAPSDPDSSVTMGSVSFEERGAAASELLSITNPASHKACRSALFITFRYSGVSLRSR
jgi:tetratricopeptide (TPR) repeat protein